MPGPKKVDPAALQQQFNVFDTSPEAEVWRALNDLKGTMPELSATTKDLTQEWGEFLQNLHLLAERFLRPAPKSKAYEQESMRTMFFEREEQVTLDGEVYVIQKKYIDQSWNTKSAFVKVYDYFEYIQDLEPATLAPKKKQFTNLIKDFEKEYQKHCKLSHPELYGIIKKCLTPLLVLMDANQNLAFLEEIMKKKKDVPLFRVKALQNKFCESFEGFCEIISKFGKLEGRYNIKRMMKKLELPDWEKIKPLQFYITPLKEGIDAVRDELLDMKKNGIDHIQYPLARNEKLQAFVIEMVSRDQKCEWILGDELKIDQIVFLYEVMKQIFESPFKNELLNKDENIMHHVIPELTAFRAIEQIRSVLDKKIEAGIDQKLDESVVKEEDEEEDKEEKKELDTSMMTETQMFKEAQKKEIEMFGRMWVWEGYISEKMKSTWLGAAEQLRHINLHVRQDIQDYLIMNHFVKTENDKQKILNRIELAKNTKKGAGKKKAANPVGASEAEIRKTLLERFRPPYCWNFFTEEEENHELRIDAKPTACYKDSRVHQFLEDLSALSYHLSHHETEVWSRLVKDVCIIFEAEENEKAE